MGVTNKFDDASKHWDAEPRRVKLAQEVASTIIREVRLSKEMSVLDYGCGTGLITLALQPLVKKVTGADSSTGMLDMLTAKVKESAVSNVSTKVVDFSRGEKIDESYDLIVSSMVMHHVADIEKLFSEFRASLTEGGMVALADLDADDWKFHDDNTGVLHPGFHRDSIRKILEAAGFVGVNTTTAAKIVKDREGGKEEFTVFLLMGRKG